MEVDEDFGLESFVSAQWPSLVRVAFLLTGDLQLAEDLAQTTCTKVFLRWSRIRRMDRPVAYTRRILVNEATSWRRRRSASEVPTELLSVEPQSGFEEHLADSSVVWNAVLSLAPRQRAVIVLRYYEDLAESEIAVILGIAPGTVKSHTHDAVAALQRRLEDAESLRTGGDLS